MAVDEASSSSPTGSAITAKAGSALATAAPSRHQRSIESVLVPASVSECDKAIGRFLYACNIPAATTEHPEFKAMCLALKCAPSSYAPPNRKVVLGRLLDDVVYDLRVAEQPLRQALLKHGGTVCSDGWDTVERDHLINMLLGTHKGTFFDGTIELRSTDHEDAVSVATFLSDFIERSGRVSVIQICTDTCSVMQAAWAIVCRKYPWVTATCCGTHVLSLELRDIAKIDEVAEVIRKVT